MVQYHLKLEKSLIHLLLISKYFLFLLNQIVWQIQGFNQQSKFAFGQSITNWYIIRGDCCSKRYEYSSWTYQDALKNCKSPYLTSFESSEKGKDVMEDVIRPNFSIWRLWEHKSSPFISDWWVCWVSYYMSSQN